VVSRRRVLEEDEKARRTEVLGELVVGGIVRAVVSRVAADGLYARFQGIEGFVPLQDLEWREPAAALKNYKRGQRVKCKILSLDKGGEKIVFGMKQLTPNPVDVIKRRFPYRSVLRVKVVSVSEGGAKVKAPGNFDGFISTEEYGHDAAPKEGQELKGSLIGVNSSTFELVLSIRKAEEMEDRRKIQQYMKGSPTLTLGQILIENSEEEGEV
jgi:small subunit ribosomal protein S1